MQTEIEPSNHLPLSRPLASSVKKPAIRTKPGDCTKLKRKSGRKQLSIQSRKQTESATCSPGKYSNDSTHQSAAQYSLKPPLAQEKQHDELNQPHRSKRAVKRAGNFGPDFICPNSTTAIKRPRKKRALEEPVLTRKADPGTYCICKGSDDGIRPMLQCDVCEDWFHFECVHISEEEVPEKYTCPVCERIKEKQKKKLSPLDLLIIAAENLKKKEASSSECKENTTSSCETDKSVDNYKEIESGFRVEKSGRGLFESLLCKDLNGSRYIYFFLEKIKTIGY